MIGSVVAPVRLGGRRRAVVIVAVIAAVIGAGWPGASGDAASPSPNAPASPGTDGPWIVYQAPFDSIDLGLVRPDGTGSHRIPGGPGNRWHPAWSPDGQWITYDWNLPSNVAQIAMLRVDGSEERTLLTCEGPCYGNGGPAFSPDGTTIGFDGAEGPTAEHEGDLCYLALLDQERQTRPAAAGREGWWASRHARGRPGPISVATRRRSGGSGERPGATRRWPRHRTMGKPRALAMDHSSALFIGSPRPSSGETANAG